LALVAARQKHQCPRTFCRLKDVAQKVWIKASLRIAQLNDEHIASGMSWGLRRLKNILWIAKHALARHALRDLWEN